MHSLSDWQERYEEVEAMLHAAGDGVQPSAGMRNRLLDAARQEVAGGAEQNWIRRASIAAAIFGVAAFVSAASLRERATLWDVPSGVERSSQKSVGDGLGGMLMDMLRRLHDRQANGSDSE